MSKKIITSLKKPTLDAAAVRAFAERATAPVPSASAARPAKAVPVAPVGPAARRGGPTPDAPSSGLVPAGDVRLTANIRGDLHLKLKIRAAQVRTTIGELIEGWVQGW